MAHHNNTPKSVLDAPEITRKWLVSHTYENRWERRHLRMPNGGPVLTIPKHVRQPAYNVPYVKE